MEKVNIEIAKVSPTGSQKILTKYILPTIKNELNKGLPVETIVLINPATARSCITVTIGVYFSLENILVNSGVNKTIPTIIGK